MNRILPFAAAGLMAAGFTPQASQGSKPTSLAKVQGYRSWYCDTPEAVDMETSVSLLCVGPAIWDTDKANPHLPRLFKLYVNPIGKATFVSTRPTKFPVGSMIVKEKYLAPPQDPKHWGFRKLPKNAKPELLTVMIKREAGFDPVNGDWEYQIVSGDKTRVETQNVAYCAKCHKDLADQDYVFQRHCAQSSETFRRGHDFMYRKKAGSR